MTVRTRFAPSPTGYLHIGGARTALFCWLYARQHQGQFILRIEDTDRERSTQSSVQAILDGMHWLDLDYDEGPFYQSERFDRYHELIETLLESGHAYRCTCSKERLDELRASQISQKQKTRYDGYCRDKNIGPTDHEHVIRFKMPLEGVTGFHDEIHGDIVVENAELDDLILVRSDGVPTYNFTVVCDDWEMAISHVVRGDDHINNTPKQINILNALGAPIPSYAHLPMILGDDGKRLSKRHGAVSVMHYREMGYLPEGLLNYLVRMGWSHGDQEIFSREEMIKHFDFNHISKSGAVVNQDKLEWLNQHYLKNMSPTHIASEFSWHLRQLDIPVESESQLLQVFQIQVERCKTLAEMAQNSRYFFCDFREYNHEMVAKHLTAENLQRLSELAIKLRDVSEWTSEKIHGVIQEMMHAHKLKLPQLALPLRVAVTGDTKSPSIDKTLELIGRERVLERIKRVTDSI